MANVGKRGKAKCSTIKCTPKSASSVGSSLKLSAAEHLPAERIAETHITGKNAEGREKRHTATAI